MDPRLVLILEVVAYSFVGYMVKNPFLEHKAMVEYKVVQELGVHYIAEVEVLLLLNDVVYHIQGTVFHLNVKRFHIDHRCFSVE
jgi:hypothetical protein